MESSENKTESSPNTFHCKICGKSYQNPANLESCSHCGVPVCSKCVSCGFCLNCFLNISEDGRKTLKLFLNLLFVLPIVALFVLFQGWVRFLVAELVIISLFTTLYFYTKQKITSNPGRYFNPKWEARIHSDAYMLEIQDHGPNLIIDDYARGQTKDLWKKPSSAPKLITEIPNNEAEEKEVGDRYAFLMENENNNSHIVDDAWKQSLDAKICPTCHESMEYESFCLQCERKFCPQCRVDNEPFVQRCLCGYRFPPLFPDSDILSNSDSH
jgi:hypothetical protein